MFIVICGSFQLFDRVGLMSARRKTHYTFSWYGHHFRNGKLYCFDRRYALVLKAWPDLRVWCKTRSRPWHWSWNVANDAFDSILPTPLCRTAEKREILCHLEDDLDTLLNRTWFKRQCQRSKAADAHLVSTFPDDVLSELFRYSVGRWNLACLFARCPGAVGLSLGSPALAYALANHWIFRGKGAMRSMRAARVAAGQGQEAIAKWLGFADQPEALRVLAAVVPASLSVNLLLRLRKHMRRTEVVERLGAMKQINADIAYILMHPDVHALAGPHLLREIENRPESQHPRGDAFFVLWSLMARHRAQYDYLAPPRIGSMAEARSLYEQR